MEGKCDCCDAKGHVLVRASSCGAVSFAYCKKCISSGREPYGAVVASLYGIGSMDEVAKWFQPVIAIVLKAEGKTVEELFQDVAAFGAEYEEALGGAGCQK